MKYFCTYFDRNYLIRAVALLNSLRQSCGSIRLWALCFDDTAYQVLTEINDPDLVPIALADFERGDEELLAAKATRNHYEYYFTCSPSLPLYVLDKNPEIDTLVYLDADLYFYSDTEPLYKEMRNKNKSVMIIEHRFPPNRPEMLKHGIYNVSILMFQNDEKAREVLCDWRAQCLDWCFDRVEAERFADQKYLDTWSARFPQVGVIEHKGAGLAPWNWMNCKIRFAGSPPMVDDQPLIFFHFHGLRIFNSFLYDPVAEGLFYGQMPLTLRLHLYPPYIRRLREAAQLIQKHAPDYPVRNSDVRIGKYGWKRIVRKVLSGQFMVSWPW